MQKIIKNILFFLTVFSLSACIVVKEPELPDVTPKLTLSPKPEIDMSDELVRSKKGDMIAFLPKDWFFVDVAENASSEIIAVAVNPDYTLSAVFSSLRTNDQVDQSAIKEGLLGLARLSLARHERKTAGAVKLSGKYSPIEMGPNAFVKYEYTATGTPGKTQVVVYRSSLNQYYEFALIPMDINGKPLPSREEIDKIFRSIVTTIRF